MSSAYHALVVDDNKANLRVLATLLSRQGITCTEVSDARQLETTLPHVGKVDLVFLDLEMPGVDGYAAKDLLRTYLGDVIIVACTVHISEMHVTQAQGFDGFIGKPLDPSRFPDQLARILRREGVWERV